MRFGTQKKDVAEFSKDSDWLRNFKAGDTKVRFIDECDDWISFREHYADKKSFPCTQDRDTCPGCTSDDEQVQRAGRKYATNVLMVDTQYVVPVKLPVTLVDSLVMRSERNGGTITSRDYVIIKTGKGIETKYDVEQDDKYQVDLSALRRQAKDIESILAQSYVAVWGELPDGSSPKPKPKAAKAAKEEDEEIPFDGASAKEADDEEVSEDAVRKMTKRELLALAGRAGVKVDPDEDRDDLVETLLAALSE